MDNSYYADGSVVHVGDIVEIDPAAAHDSYCGWVEEMEPLVGIELRVNSVDRQRHINNGTIAILRLEPVINDIRTADILSSWNFSSDMFFPSSKHDVDMADAAGLSEFLEGV